MAKKIILFLSELKDNAPLKKYSCPDGSKIYGVQTNEAPVKYLLNQHPDISDIICIVTQKAIDTKAWDYFREMFDQSKDFPTVRCLKVDYNEDDDFAEKTIGKVLERVQSKEKGENGDELFLETTGGPRNAVMYLLLLSRVLQYTGMTVSGAVYSNFNDEKIEDVSHLYSLFDLVNGMQELKDYGRVDVLRKYYEKNPFDDNIEELLNSVEALNDSIALCRRSKDVEEGLKRIKKVKKTAYDCRDPLMKKLIKVFSEKFNNSLSTRALIGWCLDSNMIQQALTVYTERVPHEILFENKQCDIVEVKNNNFYNNWIKKYGNRRKGRDEARCFFEDYFLTQGEINPDRQKERLTVIEELGDWLPKQEVIVLKREIEDIQHICCDYLYIVQLRNIINHANSGDNEIESTTLKGLREKGYPNPYEMNTKQIKCFVKEALRLLPKPDTSKG